MRFKHLIAACESSFVAQAFKQYVEKRASLSDTIINSIQGVITSDSLEEFNLVESQLGSETLQEYVFIFNKPVQVRQLLKYVYDNMKNATEGLPTEGDNVQYGPMDFSFSELIGVDKSFLECVTDLKEQFATASAIQYGYEAYLNNALTTVSDRISYFKTRMTEKFSEAAMNSVPFIQNMRSALTKSVNCQDFMNSVSDILGVKQAAEITSSQSLEDFLTANQNAGYEGTAPILSVSVKIPVLSEIWSVVKSVGSSIINFFNKVGDGIHDLTSKVVQVTENPIDVFCVNDKGNDTFDQLFWRGTDTFSGNFADLDLSQADSEYLWDWLSANRKVWFQVNTHFANMYFRIDAFGAPDQDKPDLLEIVYSYLFQPKTISIPNTYSFGYFAEEGPYGDVGDGPRTDLSSEIYSMVVQSSSLGEPKDAEAEIKFLNNTFQSILIASQVAALTAVDAGYLVAVTFPSISPISGGISVVNNADAFYLATGELSPGGMIQFDSHERGDVNAKNIMHLLIPSFIMAIVSQHTEGITYDNFFPYVRSDVTLLSGKWGIKTDAMNQAAATRFYTNTITITAAVIAAIYLSIKITKFVQNRKFKKLAYIQDVNNRISNGESMTLSEQLKYGRYAKKLGLLGSVTSGLNTGQGFSTNVNSGFNELMKQISLLIRGLEY